MQSFLWVDWVILAIVFISSMISLMRGFVREALSLVSWIAAFIVARMFHPNMQTLLADTISVPSVRFIAAFLILFVATLVVGGDRKSTRLNSSHVKISYAVFCLKKKKII